MTTAKEDKYGDRWLANRFSVHACQILVQAVVDCRVWFELHMLTVNFKLQSLATDVVYSPPDTYRACNMGLKPLSGYTGELLPSQPHVVQGTSVTTARFSLSCAKRGHPLYTGDGHWMRHPGLP